MRPILVILIGKNILPNTVNAGLLGHVGSWLFWLNKAADLNRQTNGTTNTNRLQPQMIMLNLQREKLSRVVC